MKWGRIIMWIKINGIDRTNDIIDHYIDGNTNLVNIKFKNGKQYYTYNRKAVDIGPVKRFVLKDREVLIHRDKIINDIKEYNMIGDNIIEIILNNKHTFYKRKYIHIENAQPYQLDNEEYVIACGEVKEKIEFIETLSNYFRIKYENEDKIYVYDKDNIIITKTDYKMHGQLMQYYKEIAIIKDQKSDLCLEKQLNHMELQENGVLNAYMQQRNDKRPKVNQTIYPFGINLSQRTAIKNALDFKISMIQGPPGTGKTQSILNILANIVVNQQSVAVVSNNNEAVKNVKEKMEEKGYGFLLALLGNKGNKQDFFSNQAGYPSNLKDWYRSEEKMNSLLLEIGEHEKKLIHLLDAKNEVSVLNGLISEYEHEYQFFYEYLQKEEVGNLQKLSFFHLKHEKLLELLADLNIQYDKSLNVLKKIKYLWKYGIYTFDQFDHIDQLILDIQNRYYKEKIKDLKQSKEKFDQALMENNYNSELEGLVLKSQEFFRGYLAKTYGENKIRTQFELTGYLKKSNFAHFIKEYPIILSTTYSISKSIPYGYMLDYLIVDEASQVDLVPGIIALNTAERAVIVGDLKQLPHIPDEQITDELYQTWHSCYGVPLEYNYQIQSLLSSFYAVYKEKIPNILLKEHYRSHNRIIGFCNKRYYHNELICHSNIDEEKPLVLLKTIDGNHMRFGKNAINKITNLRELESLMDDEFVKEAGIGNGDYKTFGFMSPFRGQANLAEEILPSEFQKDTVHKFQGRECDVVLFSTVLDKKYSKKLMSFVDEPHLVNVAVSRAIKKFILVSDVNVFKNRKGELDFLIRYMEYYKEDSVLFQSDVRSIFDLLYSDYNKILKEKRKDNNWRKSEYDSENLTCELIEKILSEKKYQMYKYSREVKLKEIIRNMTLLNESEKDYIKHNASADFVIYDKYDNQPMLVVQKPVVVIEVDGYKFHEDNPEQLKRDHKKNEILRKYDIPLLRLKTNASEEEEKIKTYL